MMYMCKPISKENIVTMYDERVAELEHLLEEANNKIVTEQGTSRLWEERYKTDTNILASVLYNVIDDGGLEKHHLDNAIEQSNYTSSKVRAVLEFHEAIPDGMLNTEYYVSITVPVTVCLTIEAVDRDTAEEMARDDVESNGIEYYQMEYNTYYDAEYDVTEA